MLFFQQQRVGVPPAKHTKTISAENTWTDELEITHGDLAAVSALVSVTGGAIATSQESDDGGGSWVDVSSSTPASPMVSQLLASSTLLMFKGRRYRIGIKTGDLNGGSAKITVG